MTTSNVHLVTPEEAESHDLISRDLSWLQFNHRVLDQAEHKDRSIFDRLKFLAITASNLDEFCTIRLGSLYNYLDYAKQRVDYSGAREIPFRKILLDNIRQFVERQQGYFVRELVPLFEENGFAIKSCTTLSVNHLQLIDKYFSTVVFPMLTPMVYDNHHAMPLLKNNRLLFGVITHLDSRQEDNGKHISFIQIPSNLPRFFEIQDAGKLLFVPIEDIIRRNMDFLFRNVEIKSATLFWINRNGDFTLEESEDIESNFLEELRQKLKTRRTGRVVRIEIEQGADPWLIRLLKIQWDIDDDNFNTVPKEGGKINLAGLNQIITHSEFKRQCLQPNAPVKPISLQHWEDVEYDWFNILKKQDVLLHHPYNSIAPVLELLERAAVDEQVLSIKITIYRLAKDSRVSTALLKAAENGKHVSVLFEVKARFDEENNLREAQRLQNAGCFVIYGMSNLKTHTKLMLIVRNENNRVYRYVHMASGNYNEVTSRFYTDLGMLTTKEEYAQDVSDFFNVITGHSRPAAYRNLITSPRHMRIQLINLIRVEIANARSSLPSGIVIKINSLQDKELIEALYEASQAGVPIRLIVRGICCLRPSRKGLSETIQVISIVGNFLEHARVYYFHNNNSPKIYSGSADTMVRSFDRRIESLFCVQDELLKQEIINLLCYNLRDNENAYMMQEDGSYVLKHTMAPDEVPFNAHKEFYRVTEDIVRKAVLF